MIMTVEEHIDARDRHQQTGEVEALRNMMTESFRYVDSSGRQFDGETYLELFVDRDMITWQTQAWMSRDVKEYGDVAVVQGLLDQSFIFLDAAYAGRFWCLHVYERTESGWRWQGGQETMVHEG